MKEQILAVLEQVKPLLAMHKGSVEFVDFTPETGVVQVRLLGTCAGCPLSELTLKSGIEALLLEEVLGVSEVIAVA